MALASRDPEAEFIFRKVCIHGPDQKRRIIDKPWSWHLSRHYMSTTYVRALHSQKLFDRYGVFILVIKLQGIMS